MWLKGGSWKWWLKSEDIKRRSRVWFVEELNDVIFVSNIEAQKK